MLKNENMWNMLHLVSQCHMHIMCSQTNCNHKCVTKLQERVKHALLLWTTHCWFNLSYNWLYAGRNKINAGHSYSARWGLNYINYSLNDFRRKFGTLSRNVICTCQTPIYKLVNVYIVRLSNNMYNYPLRY